MARLRDRDRGCPWDLEQTFATIAPYTIEESYEVADAIERGDLDALRDELGDLLFQVVFHARMAEELRAFDFGAVVAAICDKMRRRHPHVFGDAVVSSAAEQTAAWDEMKRQERAQSVGGGVSGAGAQSARPTSAVLADVPVGLPGLTRAVKLGKRAAGVGFDWPDASGVRAKVDEELGELDAAVAAGDADAVAAEMGDVLFSLANLCRHLELDPEECVRGANRRFTERFARVEAAVDRGMNGDWRALGLADLDALWEAAKAAESKRRAGAANAAD
jgi:MazG family protein